MARLREPKRLPDSYYLVMRRVGTSEVIRIAITQVEHELSQDACENKIRVERRLPPGRWERNVGIVRMGGVMEFEGTINGSLDVNDAYVDVRNSRLWIKIDPLLPELQLPLSDWDVGRGITGGLTVRNRLSGAEPVSVRIEDGVMTVKDLTRFAVDQRRRRV